MVTITQHYQFTLIAYLLIFPSWPTKAGPLGVGAAALQRPQGAAGAQRSRALRGLQQCHARAADAALPGVAVGDLWITWKIQWIDG